jgi:hypothetical protein
LREAYNFFGNPIRIHVRGRQRDEREETQDKPAKPARRTVDRKAVKKGPGSKPTRADRERAARPVKRTTKKGHRKQR